MSATSTGQLTTSLRKTLQRQLVLSQQLLELAKEQNAALVKNDVALLQQLNERQQACLSEQEALERTRVEIACKLGKAFGLKGVPPLQQLVLHLTKPDQEALLALRKELIRVHDEITSVHERNRLLLRNGLNYIVFSLRLLTAAALQPARYGTNLNEVVTPSFYIDSKA
jgi:hypothetical protein